MLNLKYGYWAVFLWSCQAIAQPQVELTLTQQLDPNCQGRQLTATTYAEPGQCIRYQVQIQNTGSSTAQAVKVNLPIPTHTMLQPGLASDELKRSSAIEPEQLHTEIEQLEAHEAISLYYTVQVL